MQPALLELALPAARVPAEAVGLGAAAVSAIGALYPARGDARARARRRAGALAGVVLGVVTAWWLRGRALELGVLRVGAWGAALAIAAAAAWWLGLRLSRSAGFAQEVGARALVAAALGALAGARVGYAWAAGASVVGDPSGEGLSLVGALAGGSLAAALTARAARVPAAPLLDAFAPGAALAIAIGRIGCWLHGCDFGLPLSADAPAWLAGLGTFARWPTGDGPPVFVAHAELGLVSPTSLASAPVHPTQLYEAAAWAALVPIAALVRARARRDGAAWATLVVGHALARSALELLRGDAGRAELGPALGPGATLLACWGALGAAVVIGALGDLGSPRARAAASAVALSLGPAAAASVPAGPASLITADQWVAVLAGVGVALGWSWLPRRGAGDGAAWTTGPGAPV